MKRRGRNLEEHLGLFGSPPEEQVAQAEERAFRRLRSEPATSISPVITRELTAPSPWVWRLGVIGAAATLVIAFVLVQQRIDAHAVVETEGGLYLVSGGQALHAGQRVEPGTPVRSEHGAILRLPDGARIEMHAESELSLEPAGGGVSIRLKDGSLSVTPAKEPAAPLYVQNQGITVPVVGTVFQATAAPPSAGQSSALTNESFEVVSIRRRPGGGNPGGLRGMTPSTGPGPCSMQQDPRRFAILNVTASNLISMAYAPLQEYSRPACRFNMTQAGLLSDLPDWAKNESFDVEARIPDGPPPFIPGKCCMEQVATPRLIGMLRQLLSDRFGLVLRREVKEMNAYVLSVSKGGSKLTPWKEGEFANYGATTSAGNYLDALNYPPKHDYAPQQIVALISGSRGSMDYLANQIYRFVGRPVLNRTGLSGDFNYEIVFAPIRGIAEIDADRIATGREPLPVMSKPSLFEALEEDLGLELKASKEKIDVWVVERIDRPSEN